MISSLLVAQDVVGGFCCLIAKSLLRNYLQVIEKWFREGSYKPYPDSVLQELLVRVKARVHPWLRLNRVIRDIPNQYIMGGNSVTNLRQVLQQRLKDRGQSCKCIRCRELRNQRLPQGVEVRLFQREYASSGGRELFLSFETTDEKIICGFLRLRLSRGAGLNGCFPELDGAALVRELHVYGKMRPVGSDRASASGGGSTHAQQQKHPGPTDEYLVGSAPGAKARRRRRKAAAAAAAKRKSLGPASGTAVETHSASADSAVLSSQKKSAANAPSRSDRQHAGLGRRLMRRAEELASEAGYTRLAVISGIGTRDYYRHLGFRLEGTAFTAHISFQKAHVWRRLAKRASALACCFPLHCFEAIGPPLLTCCRYIHGQGPRCRSHNF